jgi:hypothetical protein
MRTALVGLHTRTGTWRWWQRGLFILVVPWLALLAWGATRQAGSNRMLAYFASAVVALLWLGALAGSFSTPTSSVQRAAPSTADFQLGAPLPTVTATTLPAATATARSTSTTPWTTTAGPTTTRSTAPRRSVAPPTTSRRVAPTSPPTTRRRTTTTAPQRHCDPFYPGVCIPPYPPDLDCGDVPYRNFRVLAPDPHGFDGSDNEGRGCES